MTRPHARSFLARTPSAPGLSPIDGPLTGAPTPPAADYYLNRELTWLNFAWRVAQEAEDPRNPLLERVRFLAIVGGTLDEFFMKRIGGLKTQLGAGVNDLSVDGRTPRAQIVEAHAMIRELESRLHEIYQQLHEELDAEDIGLIRYSDLAEAERSELREHYVRNIFPLVTPQAMDPAHPFPFISNLSVNLMATLRHPGEQGELLARVKVPVGEGIPRLLQVGESHRFVPVEQVMAGNLDLLFPGMEIVACDAFRVTRNADTEGDEDLADDLLAMIESELRERQFAPIVRVEVPPGTRAQHRNLLSTQFELDAADIFEKPGLLGITALELLAGVERPDLRWAAHRPIDHPALPAGRSVFRAIRDAGSILLHHPYESFHTSVQRFLQEASTDPRVRAIKMTLYRTSQDSRVIEALVAAARHGKQVAVVVELKARFDEAANIRWASHLEEAGIHVSYGVVGLKTHCKVVLVVRQDRDGLLRRYSHVGTGNYHAGNARSYTDLGLLTCSDDVGHDLTELFNYLTTGIRPSRNYRKILHAPKVLKQALLDRIVRETELHQLYGGGLIQLKMNALEDADITQALYQAASAGVGVDLIVRDTCRARPGLPGLSETMRVVSIVGRFLEHARIYYFRNNGAEEYFIGSADLMKRNLESRVEALVPVESAPLRAELRVIIDTQLADARSGWLMQSDGSYIKGNVDGPTSQDRLIEHADQRYDEATRDRLRAHLER